METPPARIVVVEDDPILAEMLTALLGEAGYETRHFAEASPAFDWIKTSGADLLVTDIGLPGISGTHLCSLIRENPRTAALPVLMLTSHGGEEQKVSALRLGADDYMVKPASQDEFLARVEALLRRSRYNGCAFGVLRSGGVEIRAEYGEVRVDSALVRLLPKEYDLLLMLVRHAGRILSWDLLRDNVWGQDAVATRDTIKVTVYRLKVRLGRRGAYVQAVPGMGYRWAEPGT